MGLGRHGADHRVNGDWQFTAEPGDRGDGGLVFTGRRNYVLSPDKPPVTPTKTAKKQSQ
jgi:hypothetical protein